MVRENISENAPAIIDHSMKLGPLTWPRGVSEHDTMTLGRPSGVSALQANTRWHIDASTLAVLEQVFSLDQFPNVETRKRLGNDLNVSTRQIQVWFQNRRQRERKNRSTSDLSTSTSTTATATPVASSEDISSALLEFSGGEEESFD